MDFIMPAFINQPKPHIAPRIRNTENTYKSSAFRPPWCTMRLKFFFFTLILIAGCARQAHDHHFELEQVDTNWSKGQLNVTVHQKLMLSSEAREALVHGVPLTLQLELLIRHSMSRTPVIENIYGYEIRYLPLISRYQLTRPDTVEIRTFPKLRHLLLELSTIKQSFSKDDLNERDYELLARTHLDYENMPAPMRQ